MSSSKTVRIGKHLIGHGQRTFVIAEIGINHNGSLDTAKKLIDAAVESGCDAVKFQKRTVDVVYTAEELAKPRENPFGTTNGDLKRGLEFGTKEYAEIDKHCKSHGIPWSASCWDEASVDFIGAFDVSFFKIASASLTDDNLLRRHLKFNKPVILSTGMSDMAQVEHAAEVLDTDDLVILHCTSTYPSKPEELNLEVINTLRRRFPKVPIGYSGHEVGLGPSFAAAAMGACVIERHLTLDRSMWGSDQSASVEPGGMKRLVDYIREFEASRGDGVKVVYESEVPIRKKLRRVG